MTEKLFEFEFVNVQTGNKKSWGIDVLDAFGRLGFNDPARTFAALVVRYYIRAEVTL